MAVTKWVQGVIGAVILIIACTGAYQFARYKTLAEQRPLLDQIAELKAENTDLKLAVAEQNTSVLLAEERAQAAADARGVAQQHADALADLSQRRMTRLQESIDGMESCSEVLRRYWEIR